MSLETEIKKLGEQISTLNEHMAEYLILSKLAAEHLQRLTEELSSSTTPATKKETSTPIEKTTTAPPLTRQDLGQHLRGIALKYGDAAQTAIGKIVLARSGTQALSQVDETLLPAIKEAVDAWVGEQG